MERKHQRQMRYRRDAEHRRTTQAAKTAGQVRAEETATALALCDQCLADGIKVPLSHSTNGDGELIALEARTGRLHHHQPPRPDRAEYRQRVAEGQCCAQYAAGRGSGQGG